MESYAQHRATLPTWPPTWLATPTPSVPEPVADLVAALAAEPDAADGLVRLEPIAPPAVEHKLSSFSDLRGPRPTAWGTKVWSDPDAPGIENFGPPPSANAEPKLPPLDALGATDGDDGSWTSEKLSHPSHLSHPADVETLDEAPLGPDVDTGCPESPDRTHTAIAILVRMLGSGPTEIRRTLEVAADLGVAPRFMYDAASILKVVTTTDSEEEFWNLNRSDEE